jgi:hypothetical protein
MAWFERQGNIARARPVLHAFEDVLPSLYLRVGKRSGDAALPVAARVSHGALTGAVVEVKEAGRVIGSAPLPALGEAWTLVDISAGGLPARGDSAIAIRRGDRTLIERRMSI